MPVVSTFSSLSTRGFASSGTTILPGGQYITNFTNAFPVGVVVDNLYNSYVVFTGTGDMTFAILNNNGNVVTQQTSNSSYGSSCITIDNSGNFYLGGSTSNTSYPLISKFSSATSGLGAGTLIWSKEFVAGSQQVESIQTDTTGNIFVLSGDGTDGKPSSGYNYFLSKFDTNGNIINQRKVLKSTTSSALSLGIDNSTSQIIVSGTDYAVSNHSAIFNGLYDFNNTSVNNVVYTQSTGTANVFYNADIGNNKIVSDASALYQIATRYVSGITYHEYMRTDKSTGSVTYSNYLTVGGSNLYLGGIAYGNGYLYILGSTAYVSGVIYIAKVNPSDGTFVWQKTLRNSTGTYTHIVNGIYYYNGFIYFNASFLSSYGLTIKLKDDGSLPDGTYGGFYTFATVSATVTSLNTSNTSITTDSTSTTSYSILSPSITMASSSYTVSTTAIP